MTNYINNPNVAIINVFHDDIGVEPYCTTWGDEGIEEFPIIIDDYQEEFYSHIVGDWFGVSWSSPWHVFVDHNYTFYAKTQDKSQVDDIIEEMLENIE